MFATVSLNSILAHNPCEEGLEAFKLKFGHLDPDTTLPLLACLESNSVPDVIWALRAVHQDISTIIPLIAADFAESVLYRFEEKFPNDDRPRKAIEAARRGDKDASGKASAAAYAAAASAYAAYAAYAASYAAYAASYAAAYAADDAAFTAFSAAASTAFSAADAAYDSDAERLKQAEILRKYFSNQPTFRR